jgi:GrpB-like predicted nucleotidyltransferase (UPF0157 family)
MSKEHKDQHTPLSEEYLRAVTVGDLQPLSEPIRVLDYDPGWPVEFQHHAEQIRSAVGERALRIEHVGSTAVPGLPAKPIVDMVLVVADSAAETEFVPALDKAGYRLFIREPVWYEHRMFKRPEGGVNLHVFSAGCPEIDRMVTFRNWLRGNAADRELYALSKRTLANHVWKYTQNYADAKTEVIQEILARAERSAVSPTSVHRT